MEYHFLPFFACPFHELYSHLSVAAGDAVDGVGDDVEHEVQEAVLLDVHAEAGRGLHLVPGPAAVLLQPRVLVLLPAQHLADHLGHRAQQV